MLLLKENNRTREKPRQEEMLSWSGALGLAQAFCCVSAESRRAATPHCGLLLPKPPLHLNWNPVLLQIQMGIHGPEACRGSEGPTLAPLGGSREQLEDFPPSLPPGDCLVSSWSSSPPRGSVSTRALPHACFSWTYTTFITLQPSASSSGSPGFRSCWGATNMGWLGETRAHFVRKQHRCWVLCHGSEQRSQAVKQPRDLGVNTQKNQCLDQLGQMSKIPHW